MVNITKSAVRKPITIVLCLITIAYSGVQSLLGTKLELTLEMETPMSVIAMVYAGASPEDVNDLVTVKQGDAISTLNGVDTVQSYPRENMAVVPIQYEYNTNMDTACIDLRKAIDGIRSDMPDGTEEPNIMELDMNSQPVVTFAVSGAVDGNFYTYVDEKPVPEFGKLGSMGEVPISGGQKEYARIELIPEKLEQYHLSISTVAQLVGAVDSIIPTDDINAGKQKLDVSVGDDYESTESLKNVAIPLSGGDIIHLSNVAEVCDALEEEDSIGRYNDQDTISLGIKKQQSLTAIEVPKQVLSEMDELQEVNPGISITAADDSSETIMESIPSVVQTTIMAIIPSVIILWLLYGDIRASVIVGTSIPISVVLVLIYMSAMGFSLNVTSLISLVLGVGTIVGNSINVLDGCFRVKEKPNFYDATIEGSRTMIGSITGGTITTCVVFLPPTLLSGMSGQLSKQLGYTIVFCLTVFLFSAVIIVSLCYLQWHSKESSGALVNRGIKFMQIWYRSHMPSIISRTKAIFTVSIRLLAVALLMASQLNLDLMTPVDEGIVQVIVKTKPGPSVTAVNEAMADLEELAGNDENVDHYLLTYGSSGLNISGGSDVTLDVYLKDGNKLSTDQAIEKWRYETQYYKDCSVSIKQGSTMSSGALSSGDEIEVDLQSTDYDAPEAISDQLVEGPREREDVMQVHSSTGNAAPAVKVEVDLVKAQAEGLTPASIGSAIYSSLSGIKASVTRVNEEDVDVKVESAPDRYDSIGKLQGMMITTASGTMLPLEDLANIYYQDSPQQIERKDKQYQVVTTVQPQAEYKKTAEKDVKTFINEWKLPGNVSPATNSMDEMIGEELGALGGTLVIGVFLILIVMGIQSEPLRYSLTVMVTIPFGPAGSFGLLYLTGSLVSMVLMLGFLMLVGIVVNNGILYVDTVNQTLVSVPLMEALVEAGAIRMRLILTTTLTTVISMIPSALAYERAGKMMQGPTLVNIGGFMASMVPTLILLPTFYKVVYRLGRKWIGGEGEPSYD